MANIHIDDQLFKFTNRVGLTLENELEHLKVNFFKGFTFLPDMAIHFGSFFISDNFTRITTTSDIADGIGFVFHNIFEDETIMDNNKHRLNRIVNPPYVRVFPYAIRQHIDFKKNTCVTLVSISISATYLKSYLKEELEHFQYLFSKTSNFWIEELMTDNILQTVNKIVKNQEPPYMRSFHYKILAMELLFYLFESLKKREQSASYKISAKEIEAVYRVRDQIVSSLSKFSSIKELKSIAGMNELKLRKLFKQIFGMGIYDYYQHLRMNEAARLLREDNISVSETAYKIGYDNLGHFTRVFEKHVGKKPLNYKKSLP